MPGLQTVARARALQCPWPEPPILQLLRLSPAWQGLPGPVPTTFKKTTGAPASGLRWAAMWPALLCSLKPEILGQPRVPLGPAVDGSLFLAPRGIWAADHWLPRARHTPSELLGPTPGESPPLASHFIPSTCRLSGLQARTQVPPLSAKYFHFSRAFPKAQS